MILRFKSILVFVFSFFTCFLFAQQGETDYYYYQHETDNTIPIDTSLYDPYEYNFMDYFVWDYFNIGNTGQAHYLTTFRPDFKAGFKDGMNAFNQYKYSLDRIKYYKSEKPYSEINYFIGSKRENIFGARLAQNIKNRFDFGVDFHRILSNGVYQDMRSKNGSFSLYGKFYSKNSRYQLSTAMVFNQLKAEENGGLVEDFVNNPNLKEPNKEFYTPILSPGLTRHKNFTIESTQSYFWGIEKTDSISDSLNIKRFYPTFGIHHTFGTTKNTFEYIDNTADSSFYGDFFQAVDSTFYRLYYHNISNKIHLSYSGITQSNDSIFYRNIQSEAGIQHNNIELWQNRAEFTTNNLSVFALIQGNQLAKKKWNYALRTHYFLTGYNQHDLQLSAKFSYNFDKWGYLSAYGVFDRQEAAWIEQSYFTNTFVWQNDFKKKQIVKTGLFYSNSSWNLTAGFDYFLINNHIYFNEDAKPIQVNNTIHYFRAYLQHQWDFKILHWKNEIGIQQSSNEAVLPYPLFYGKSNIYIQGKIFKGNMLAKIGAQLRYNTPFQIPSWQPLTGQFYIPNEANTKFTPVLDMYLSLKVRSLRVFVKANFLNEGLIQTNYLTATNYPDRGRTFVGGLIWRFFE